MNEITLAEIEEEIDIYAEKGNIVKVMDLVDEHGSTIDKMFYAIAEGDYERIHHLDTLGIDITDESFIRAAVKHDQFKVQAAVVTEETKTADIDLYYKYFGTNLTIEMKGANAADIDDAIEELNFLFRKSIEILQREKSKLL